MKRVTKFVLDTRGYGLKIFPSDMSNSHWKITVYTDSDWAGDKDNRRSVSGFVLYLMGVPIMWRSRQLTGVSLSSSEAEYIALSEAAKEIQFMYQLMTTMGLKVATPITVYVDNVGAMFMAENVSTSQRTRHIDIRWAYVREFLENKFLKIVFVKSEENLSDGMTKNTSSDVYERHTPNYVIDNEDFLKSTSARTETGRVSRE